MSPESKTVLVTGASSGIGRATAQAFANEGYKVAIADVDLKGGQKTKDLIEEQGGDALLIAVDVTNPGQVESAVSQVISIWGTLDCAVNNAGISGPEVALDTLDSEDWQKVINVNLSGVFYCMKYELKQMVNQNHGVVVNVSSIAGLGGFYQGAAYSASKHGVIGLTKSGALEYGKSNIRINAVAPVFTNTPILDNTRFADAEVQKKVKRNIPLGRFGEARDVAETILYLCSDQARFLSGVVLPIDGGMTAG